MLADTINFCKNYEVDFEIDRDREGLNGTLVDYVITTYELIIRLPDGTHTIVADSNDKKNIFREVIKLQKSEGVALLRVDIWKTIGKLSFLVFQKEQVKQFNTSLSEAFAIGVDPECQRGKSIGELKRHFILEAPNGLKYVFMTSSSKNAFEKDVFGLIGDTKTARVEKGFKNGWYIKSIRPRKIGAEIYGEIYLVGDNITLVKGETITQANIEEEYNRLVSDSNNTELIKLWEEYSKIEEDFERESANEYVDVCPHFSDMQYDGPQVVFTCDNMRKSSLDRFLSCDLGFAIVKEKDAKTTAEKLNPVNQIYVANKLARDPHKDNVLIAYRENNDKASFNSGYLVPSLKGAGYKNRRRAAARSNILQLKNPLKSLGLIVQAGQVIEKMNSVPIPLEYLNSRIFPNSEEKLNDAQVDAIASAINTPDIALIQGPPGTGKTKIIKALLAYLEYEGKKKNKEYSVLVTSESHDAVDNAVKGTTYGGFPCKRIGGKFGTELNNEEYDNWINNIKQNCKAWMLSAEHNQDYEEKVRKIIVALEICRKSVLKDELNKKEISEAFCNLEIAIDMVFHDRDEVVERIKAVRIKCESSPAANRRSRDKEKLEELFQDFALDEESFELKGSDWLNQFINIVKNNPDFLPESYRNLPSYWSDLLYSDASDPYFSENMANTIRDIEVIGGYYYSHSNKEQRSDLAKECLQIVEIVENDLSKNYRNSTWNVATAIGHFLSHIDDDDSTDRLLSDYARYTGATCQQSVSGRVGNLYIQPVREYDYVIIDEAAKANPLDLLIPMSLGRHIIMVGDHKQLPHMVENRIVKEVLSNYQGQDNSGDKVDDNTEQENQQIDRESVLKESLFARIYNSMSAQGLGRTVMLDLQFRMHPKIADLISDSFYNGTLRSAPGIEEKREHNIPRYRRKPIVFIDIPKSEGGLDVEDGYSYYRQSEVDRAAEEAKEIISATDDTFSIGVISFYSAQIDRLKDAFVKIIENNPHRIIKIGSVDAFQGQEFDAVILSSVRSNDHSSFKKSIGFLASKQRQNVAFSRARKLLILIGDKKTICRFKVDDDKNGTGTEAFSNLISISED